ncbi:MAG TPA: DUF2341 domain-containing protein, partial [Fibrobacteria bacterium]|nr:DUF2341 domain-containing protein [Fibrobacteria bacterium]
MIGNRSFVAGRVVAAAMSLGLVLLAQSAIARSATLTVGSNADWANLPESMVVRNFPLLVRLDSSTFDFAQARNDGSDLRFTTLDNKLLHHQIDSWDASKRQAAIWVQLDSLKGGTTRNIRMHWSNTGANMPPPNESKVFDTEEGFMGVWHLQEKADAAEGRFRDATVTGRHATGFGLTEAATVPGIIGNTQTFD